MKATFNISVENFVKVVEHPAHPLAKKIDEGRSSPNAYKVDALTDALASWARGAQNRTRMDASDQWGMQFFEIGSHCIRAEVNNSVVILTRTGDGINVEVDGARASLGLNFTGDIARALIYYAEDLRIESQASQPWDTNPHRLFELTRAAKMQHVLLGDAGCLRDIKSQKVRAAAEALVAALADPESGAEHRAAEAAAAARAAARAPGGPEYVEVNEE